jgi:hypothetical protein
VLVSQHSLAAFPASYYELIVAKDVLEHIPRTLSQRVLLEFNSWLALGGTLELQTSSVLGVAELIRARQDFEFQYGMVNCLFGTQAHPGDFHLTGFTEVTLKVMLLATGYSFGDFGLVDGWMYKLDAKKTKDWFTWSDSIPASDDDFVQAVFASALERRRIDGCDALDFRQALCNSVGFRHTTFGQM